MSHYAILCGSAPDGFMQKKINEMHDFLISDAGGSWAEKDIVIFPNGVDEAMLSFVLEGLKADKLNKFFYIYALCRLLRMKIKLSGLAEMKSGRV